MGKILFGVFCAGILIGVHFADSPWAGEGIIANLGSMLGVASALTGFAVIPTALYGLLTRKSKQHAAPIVTAGSRGS